MRWAPVNGLVGPEGLVPGDFVPAFLLGIVGLVWCVVRRERVGLLVGLALVGSAGYLLLPLLDLGLINNGRLCRIGT